MPPLSGAGTESQDDPSAAVHAMWRRDGPLRRPGLTVTTSSGRRRLAAAAGFAAALSAVGPRTAVAQNQWATAGPEGGEVRALLVTAPGEVVAATYGAGLFRTTNGAANWSQFDLRCHLDATSLAVGSLAMYWGTDGGGVCRQGGSRVGTILSGEIRAVAATDNHVWAGTVSGLFHISDMAGSSTKWTSTNVSSGVWALLVDRARSRMYVGAASGVFEADLDVNGVPAGDFSPVNGPKSGRALTMDANFVYAVQDAVNGCQVYRRPVGSGAWTLAGGSACAVSMTAPADGELVAAGPTLVSRSTNGGVSFSPVMIGLPPTQMYSVASDGSGAVYLGTFAGVFKTTKGGASWAPANTGLVATWVRSLARDGSGALYAAVFGGGVAKSVDRGAIWSYANTGLASLSVDTIAIGPGEIFAGTQGEGVFRSTDGGAHWTKSSNGLGNLYVRALAHDGASTLYSAHLFSGTNDVYRSTNGGSTWSLASSGITANVNAFALESASVVYAASEGGGVFKTTDGGLNWSPVNAGLGHPYVRAITRTPAGTLYAGTGNGLFRSADGAASWAPVALPISNLTSVAVDSAGGLYAGGASSVWRSADGGATWANVGPGRWVHSLAVEDGPRRFVYAGIIGGVRVLDAGPPTITAIAPVGGPTSGGTTVTVSGTEFVQSFTTVRFGGVQATAVSVSSATTLTATTPVGASGVVDVSVETGGGRVVLPASFTYGAGYTLTVLRAGAGSGRVTGVPSGIDCGPDCSETYAAGTPVTLTASAEPGSSFTGWSGACTGTQSCAVTMNAGRSVTATFALVTSPPTVTGIVPAQGPTTGGTRVTIRGMNFTASSTVTIDGTAAGSVAVVDATAITAITPPGTAGPVLVVVTTPGGTATLTGGFRYVANAKYDAGTPTAAARMPALDGGGRYLAFVSAAPLVSGDGNQLDDVHVLDRVTGTLVRISERDGGGDANGPSFRPRISDDGRIVAFVSGASDLVGSDANGTTDVFIRDRDLDGNGVFDEPGKSMTRRVSVAATAGDADAASGAPDLSADGFWVAFVSSASNLVAGDTNGFDDVFAHHWPSGRTVRVSVASDGTEADGPSSAPVVSRGGLRVAFASDAANLAAGDRNGFRDVFLHDRLGATTVRVSTAADGLADADGPSDRPSIDDSGRTLAFQTRARAIVGGTGAVWQIVAFFLSDAPVEGLAGVQEGDGVLGPAAVVCIPCAVRQLVSQTSQGEPGSGDSTDTQVSPDGARVGYETDGDDPGGGDDNGRPDVMIVDVDPDAGGGPPERVSVDADGNQMDAASGSVTMSRDGHVVAFETTGSVTPDTPDDSVQRVVVRGEGLLVSGLTPASVPVGVHAPPLEVVLHGAGLETGVRVWIGGLPTDVTWHSSGEAIARVPDGSQPGAVDVVIENPDGERVTLGQGLTYTAPQNPDADNDGLPDAWEVLYGLDPTSGAGHDGAGGDPDGDGVVNAEENRRQTHPRGVFTRYLAEGATGFFETRVSVANPGAVPAAVLLRFLRLDGSARAQWLTVPARHTRKVDVSRLPEMDGQQFSTVVESDQSVIVDRLMSWDRQSAWGAHAEAAVPAPSTTWYFAEGATHSGFDLYYLLQNGDDVDATVLVRYLRPKENPLQKTYTVRAHSRTTIWVNGERFPGEPDVLALASTDVSAAIEVLSGPPVVAERAMYLTSPGGSVVWEAGHESAGVPAPALSWFLAEGATGALFDTFVLLANPSSITAQVRGTYLLLDGTTVTKTYELAANSRKTIWLDIEEFPEGSGNRPLASAQVSTIMRSTNGVPVVVERAMWWPGDFSTWYEAHNAVGSTATANRWAFAEGTLSGPPSNVDTFYLVANTADVPAQVRVTLLFEDDGGDESRDYTVPGHGRLTVWVRQDFPAAMGRGFGAVVESLDRAPIVVERAMYTSPDGMFGRAGSNALGTRLP